MLYREHGWSSLDLGRFEDALDAFDRVIEIDPDSWEARRDRAAAGWGLRDFESVVADYTAALEGIPDQPRYAEDHWNLLLDRGQANLFLRRFDASRADLEQAAALDPGTAIVWSYLGRLDLLEGRYDRAVELFERGFALAEDKTAWFLERGIAHWMAGHDERAAADLRRFAETDKKDGPWLRLSVWEIEMLGGNTAAADHQLVLAAKSDNEPLRRTVRVFRGEAEESQALAAADSDEDRLLVSYALGILAFVRGDEQRAAERFDRCTDLGLVDHWENDLAEWHLRRLNQRDGREGTSARTCGSELPELPRRLTLALPCAITFSSFDDSAN
jgi:lipoprotein NlpI